MTPTADFTLRHIPFDRWFNVRDIGGYPTTSGRPLAWGRLFRAGAPGRLVGEDVERARGLGLRTEIDLRGTDEAGTAPSPLAAMGVEYHLAPVATLGMLEELDRRTGVGTSPERYLAYLDLGADGLRTMFELLAEPERYPVAVHCGMGNHRTGVAIAVLLSALGVPDQVIVDDYAMTNIERDRLAATWHSRGWLTDGPGQVVSILGVDPALIEGFLRLLHETFGDAASYLHSTGVTDATLAHVHANLVEAAP